MSDLFQRLIRTLIFAAVTGTKCLKPWRETLKNICLCIRAASSANSTHTCCQIVWEMKKIHQTAKNFGRPPEMQIHRYLKEKAENHVINRLQKTFPAVCWCNQTKFEIKLQSVRSAQPGFLVKSQVRERRWITRAFSFTWQQETPAHACASVRNTVRGTCNRGKYKEGNVVETWWIIIFISCSQQEHVCSGDTPPRSNADTS